MVGQHLVGGRPGPDGGFYGSTPAQPVSGPEDSYQDAAARARAESLLPGVTDSQIFRNDAWWLAVQ